MRVLAAADIHGVLFVYEWLMSHAASVDAVVLAGDLFDGDWEEGQRRQAANIVPILRRSTVPLLYLMGNDDNVPLDYEDDLIRPLHGRRIELGEYNFVGYQYTPPFVGETFVKPDQEIAADLVAFESLLDARTVLVTHTPALGALDYCEPVHVGSRALADLLRRRPVLAHVHGHIHQHFGVDGNHFNVAAAASCRAMLIDLPSLDHEVIRYPVSP